MKNLTDLELIDKFCVECITFIDPRVFREIEDRGLYSIINRLPYLVEERKATARARLKLIGAYVGDPEIEQIADEISRIKALQIELFNTPASEVIKILTIIENMNKHLFFVRDYFKKRVY